MQLKVCNDRIAVSN